MPAKQKDKMVSIKNNVCRRNTRERLIALAKHVNQEATKNKGPFTSERESIKCLAEYIVEKANENCQPNVSIEDRIRRTSNHIVNMVTSTTTNSNKRLKHESNIQNVEVEQKKLKVCNDLKNLGRSENKILRIKEESMGQNKELNVKLEANKRELSRKEVEQDNRSVSCQTANGSLLSIATIMNNDRAIKFYTGLQNYEKFMYVFNTLGSNAFNLTYYYDEISKLTPLDQFLMTLIILKQRKTHYEISILFDITLKDIKNVFITWIRFMKLEWKNIKFLISYVTDNQSSNSNNDQDIVQKESFVKYFKEISDNEKSNSDNSPNFKSVYKILDGPQNYIESYLFNDIIFVCNTLSYFRAQRIQAK